MFVKLNLFSCVLKLKFIKKNFAGTKIYFTFVNENKKHPKNGVKQKITVMKDRIRTLQEQQHMTQNDFAHYIGLSPAALSSIYKGRTKPTLNTVEAIRSKMPQVSLEWLVFGTGDMMDATDGAPAPSPLAEGTLAFPSLEVQDVDMAVQQSPSSSTTPARQVQRSARQQEQKPAPPVARRITEIRVFYDDQTYESFQPRR